MLVERTAAGPQVAIPVSPGKPEPRYVWSLPFDLTLLTAPLLVGVMAAVSAAMVPALFPVLLAADVWLLGYHHIVATYTRLAFDRVNFSQHKYLAVHLLLVVLAMTVGVLLWLGAWVIATTFLYLQWFHYMRQGYGIARMYFRTTPRGQEPGARDMVTDAVMYLVPIYGIAYRSSTLGSMFLGFPVKPLVLPEAAITALGVAAALAVAFWWIRTGRDAMRGEGDTYYAGFVLSHIVIFLVGYVLISDANAGWLGVNIWHNFQYVMVVWMVNAKRYSGGIDPRAKFISTISQPHKVVTYFACCLAISSIVYFNLQQVTAVLLGNGIVAMLGVYMGINFHHYVVDAVIWKRRRMPAQTQASGLRPQASVVQP